MAAAEQLTDQEKLFRVRARRRLIGAVALVLLMLTILPMLLDDRSNQNMPAPDVAISIPSQDDGNFASRIVPVAPAPLSPDSSMPPSPEIQKTEPAQPPATIPVAPAAAEAQPVTEIKPVIEKAGKPEVEKPTTVEKLAVAEKPTDEKPVAARKGAVSVQVGVISEGEKVKQVLDKIAALGLKSNTENLNTPTGVKVRIRCGPYATRAEAEQALETLKSAGFKPILVTHK